MPSPAANSTRMRRRCTCRRNEFVMEKDNTARAFWIRGPNDSEIRPVRVHRLSQGEVRVRTLFSGISRGTESLVYRGEVPQSQRSVMQAPFQEGEFSGPVKYGYMNVGVVEAGLGLMGESLVGRTVFCLYPHQERYVVPASAVTPLPDGLPPGRAVLAANMETAVNGAWDARPAVGDRILIVGGGVVGMLTAWLCARTPGAEVLLVDPNPARAAVAETLGVEWKEAVPADSGQEPGMDLVIHASGNPEGLAAALSAAGREARVVELSWYGDQRVSLPLGEAFHSRRLTIRSSQVGRIPPERSPRWDYARRKALALELLRDPALDAMITGESDFEALPEVMAALARDPGDTLCHRIRYPG